MVRSDLGTFRGFNTRTGELLPGQFTADQIVAWDHYANGVTEFHPTGDREEVVALFGINANIQGRLLLKLDELLQSMGGDHLFNFLLLHMVLNGLGKPLDALTAMEILDMTMDVGFAVSAHIPVREQFFRFEREFDITFRRGIV